MLHFTRDQKIHYTLRIAVAMCYIGHGSFGIITKPVWCHYFAVFGIGQDLAYQLMPVMGSIDILAGVAMLAYPLRAIPGWLVGWGIVTALLRPLSGEPFAEFVERAGNFGAPLALLFLSGGGGTSLKRWFTKINPSISADQQTRARVIACLRIAVFLLLTGHGWLNLMEKKELLSQYASIGFSNPASIAISVGLFEIIAACAVLIRPFAPLLLVLLVWKVASELFYPHYALFEWIERGGSYGCLLALWFAVRWAPRPLANRHNVSMNP
ncbi:MAG: hypothetical protein Q8927_04680 [Bacteroidota bacterium]|nr:hypothetical protein [Bacteroidota bacterium]MDP4215473.1 hypothetical protein [Bacteroidota bacterium]MDP4246013.1 hypothetical protein [Bacteroidota bacterium]MDP4254973.1 hypothetical protein [Bacteroidota bacterium]MDP4257794.1 hypothetical protein [Bacteroidota bacterium]